MGPLRKRSSSAGLERGRVPGSLTASHLGRPLPPHLRSLLPGRHNIYFTGLLFMATHNYPTVESPTSNYENCQGDHQKETTARSPLRESARRRVLPRARGRMRAPPRGEGAGRLRTGHTRAARSRRRCRARPGPALLYVSNWKAAPGFPVSRCHVSKWLFSVRPIRKLTHHAVTAANFFPLHVRWIAR